MIRGVAEERRERGVEQAGRPLPVDEGAIVSPGEPTPQQRQLLLLKIINEEVEVVGSNAVEAVDVLVLAVLSLVSLFLLAVAVVLLTVVVILAIVDGEE